MLYIEGAMHRKVKWWVAILAILVLAGIAAYAISARALSYPFTVGGRVTAYNPSCVTLQPSGKCSCTMCQLYCDSVEEILLTPFGGTRPQPYICPLKGFRYTGRTGVPTIGGYIIAGGFAENLFGWIGVGR